MDQNLRFLVAALIGAISLAGSAARAQQGDQQMPMMRQGMMRHMGMGMMRSGDMCAAMQGMMGRGTMMNFGPMMEGRLAYIKAELGVAQAQMSAWNHYASAVETQGTAMQDMHTAIAQATQTGSALDRLDAHTKVMESMVEALKALRPATEALYKVLSADQKKKADLLLGAGCCMM